MKLSNEIEELVYEEYLLIASDAFQEKIRYFERYKQNILEMPFQVSFKLRCEYLIALFEVGADYQFLKHVDNVIDLVIEENIYKFKGEDIFQLLLFKKGKALYNIVDYKKAKHVLSELVKMDSQNEKYRQAYHKNEIDFFRYKGQAIRAASIVMFLITGIGIAVELLMIRCFFPDWTSIVENGRNICFFLGLFLFLFQEFNIRRLSYNSLNSIVKK